MFRWKSSKIGDIHIWGNFEVRVRHNEQISHSNTAYKSSYICREIGEKYENRGYMWSSSEVKIKMRPWNQPFVTEPITSASFPTLVTFLYEWSPYLWGFRGETSGYCYVFYTPLFLLSPLCLKAWVKWENLMEMDGFLFYHTISPQLTYRMGVDFWISLWFQSNLEIKNTL